MSTFEVENRIRWEPGMESLPMRAVLRGSRIAGVFLLVFGTAWSGFLWSCIVLGSIHEGFRPGLALVMGVFSLGGLGFIYFGLVQLWGRSEVFIDRESVRVRQRGVFRRRDWSEPLAAYQGVLKRVRRTGSSSSVRYEVVLHHDDLSRVVLLFQSWGGRGVDDVLDESWRRLAAALGRPALRENSAGVSRVELGQAGSSWIEREGGGRRPGGDLSGLDLGRSIRVEWKEGAWRLRFRRAYVAWRPLLGVVVSTALLAVGLALRSAHPDEWGLLLFCGVMALFALVLLGGVISELRAVEELRISSEGIAYRRRPGGARRERFVPLAEITDLVVARGARSQIEALKVSSRGGGIVFGSGLPGPVLHRLREALAAYLVGRSLPAASRSRREIGQSRWASASTVAVALAGFSTLIGAIVLTQLAQKPVPQTPVPAQSWNRLYNAGEQAVREQDLVAAEAAFRQALAATEEERPGRGPTCSTLRYLGWVLERQQRYQEAAPLLERALEMAEERSAAETSREYQYVGITEMRAGNMARAEQLLRLSLEGETRDERFLRRGYDALAELYDVTGRRDQAQALRRERREGGASPVASGAN